MNKRNYVLAAALVKNLREKGVLISFAESCTGGLIASAITDIAGASEIFLGSAVTYSNSAKENILGVRSETLKKYGAVSEECAKEMAAGSKKIYGSEIAMSVTGIAGPDGGSAEKPVGTVWFGFASKSENYAFVCHFDGNREDIRNKTVEKVLSTILEKMF